MDVGPYMWNNPHWSTVFAAVFGCGLLPTIAEYLLAIPVQRMESCQLVITNVGKMLFAGFSYCTDEEVSNRCQYQGDRIS